MIACNWPVDTECLSDEWEGLGEALQDRALSLASQTLTRLTGYRVSNCPVTVRPCSGGCIVNMPPNDWARGGFAGPRIRSDGEWVNACGHHDCSCDVLCEVLLPGPVGRVDEVKVDGGVINPAEYRVDANRLVYTGAFDCPFPVQQDLSKPDTEDNTFSVTYLNAYPVDGNGAYAAAVLAMEFAKACRGKKCRLPATVTEVTRQGVSFSIPTGSFEGGVTGIREVDAYVALWNPNHVGQPTSVLNIDQRRYRVVN